MMRVLMTAAALLLAGCGNGGEETGPASAAPSGDSAGLAAGKAAGGAPGRAAGTAPPFSADVLAAAATITAENIRAHVAELSSDAYGGRDPGTDGDDMARRYLAERLVELGYAPGAGASYQQPFDLVAITAAQPPEWTFRRGGESRTLAQHQDFIVASGTQAEQAAFEDAELVFVGYGIQAPEHNWDDFGDADLRGKVLVMLNNDPDWDPALFEGERRLYYGRWTYKYESAARQGAAGAIIIHTTPSAGYPWQVVQTSWTGTQFELPQGDEPRLAARAWVTEAAARSLVSWSGRDLDELVESAKSRDFQPVPLGITTGLSLTNTLDRVQSANVLGLLQGSDPVLKDQVVVFTAHHDHLGTDPDAAPGEDAIYNGARDNAAGVANVLAIARAFAALPTPPRRSILINFVGAEEQGLLGSKYYAENPTFPPGRIAANINYDGGGIWGATEDMVYIGLGKSDLDTVARTVIDYQGGRLEGDQDPGKGYYYRSDQFSFARIGVPAIFARGGNDVIGKPDGWGKAQIDAYTEHDYHQVSDELTDAWDFSGLVREAEFGFLAGVLVANQDAMPAWTPGDEFEAARQAALATVPAPVSP